MRLFVSLRPSAEAVAHLEAQRPSWPSAPERWHVTLAFLGDVELDPVRAALAERLRGRPAFDLRLEGSGDFGRNGPVWVGVGGEVAALRALAAEVQDAARQAGVPLKQQSYRPHLTVGKRGHPPVVALADYAGPTWRAREVELVRSDLGRTVTHTVLERYPLGQPWTAPSVFDSTISS